MSKLVKAALSVSIAVASAGSFATEEKGLYVGGNAHYTFVDDQESVATATTTTTTTGSGGLLDPLLNALGLGALSAGGTTAGSSLATESSFEDDWGYSAILGYKFSGPLRAELEYRLDSNAIEGSNADLDVESLLGNLWYDFSLSERLRPYIGAGLGQSTLEIGSYDDDVLTAQLGAGLYFHLTPRLVLDASYRYTEALDDPPSNVGGVNVETEYSSHNVGLGLRFNFFEAKYGVQDDDGDGVANETDQCPGTPAGVQVDSVGCPLDGDNDGVADYLDQCLNTPAGAEVNDQGCELDSDGDGVVDANDMCPDTPAGTEVMANGCGADQSVVLRGVNFETNSANLTINAESILNGVADTLGSSTGFDVELQGHTDSTGNDSYNMSLSTKRANAVKTYLVGQGVDGGRLVARGYGEEQPIATNKTAEGRALNRRVEMKVLGESEVMAEEPMMMDEPMVEEPMAEEPMVEEAIEPMDTMEDDYLEEAEADMEEEVEEVEEEYEYDYSSDSDEIDYDLKDGAIHDGDAELSDFDDWWGVERQGEERGMSSDDDDDADGGGRMQILGRWVMY